MGKFHFTAWIPVNHWAPLPLQGKCADCRDFFPQNSTRFLVTCHQMYLKLLEHTSISCRDIYMLVLNNKHYLTNVCVLMYILLFSFTVLFALYSSSFSFSLLSYDNQLQNFKTLGLSILAIRLQIFLVVVFSICSQKRKHLFLLLPRDVSTNSSAANRTRVSSLANICACCIPLSKCSPVSA